MGMKKYTSLKLNNEGAALVMAILVIAFVSILTTVLLYLANMNYQMKSTDFKTKDVFYNAEVPLETIRTRLVMDVATASAEAYDISVLNYANVASDVRASEFQTNFYESVIEAWKTRCKNGSVEWDWVYGLTALYNEPDLDKNISPIDGSDIHVLKSTGWSDSTGCSSTGCTKSYHIILDDSITDSNRLKVHTETEGVNTVNKLRLEGVKLVFTKNEFTSIIETNYNIIPPSIDLSINSFVDDDPTEAVKRKDIDFETCVTYIGYKKQ